MLEVKNKHAEIWRLINSVRDWKNAKWGIIKEKSKEDRIKLKIGTGTYSTYWEMKDRDPVKVLEGLKIEDEYFIEVELELVKIDLNAEKETGPDNIQPEILKRWHLDAIILKFPKRLLHENVKPKQLPEIDMIPVQ